MRQENLKTGLQEVDAQYRLASLSGKKIIRLILLKTTAAVQSIVGFELLADAQYNDPTQVNQQIEVGVVGGSLNFYPDENEFAWAYLPKTPHNMRCLAAQLKLGMYRIVEQDELEEAREYARKEGWPDEVVEHQHESVRTTVREKDAIKRAEEAEERATLAEQQATLAKAEAQRALAKARAQAGLSADDSTLEPVADSPDDGQDDGPAPDSVGTDALAPAVAEEPVVEKPKQVISKAVNDTVLKKPAKPKAAIKKTNS